LCENIQMINKRFDEYDQEKIKKVEYKKDFKRMDEANSNKHSPKVWLIKINMLSKTVHRQNNWKSIWLQKHKERVSSEMNKIVRNKEEKWNWKKN